MLHNCGISWVSSLVIFIFKGLKCNVNIPLTVLVVLEKAQCLPSYTKVLNAMSKY